MAISCTKCVNDSQFNDSPDFSEQFTAVLVRVCVANLWRGFQRQERVLRRAKVFATRQKQEEEKMAAKKKPAKKAAAKKKKSTRK